VNCNPIYERIGAILQTFAHAKRQDQASDRGKRLPNPGIAISFPVNLNHEKVIFFGMHKAPEFIQLTFGDMHLISKMQNDQSTLRGAPRSSQSLTASLLTCRIRLWRGGNSFGQCPHGGFKIRRIALQNVSRSIFVPTINKSFVHEDTPT